MGNIFNIVRYFPQLTEIITFVFQFTVVLIDIPFIYFTFRYRKKIKSRYLTANARKLHF